MVIDCVRPAEVARAFLSHEISFLIRSFQQVVFIASVTSTSVLSLHSHTRIYVYF